MQINRQGDDIEFLLSVADTANHLRAKIETDEQASAPFLFWSDTARLKSIAHKLRRLKETVESIGERTTYP